MIIVHQGFVKRVQVTRALYVSVSAILHVTSRQTGKRGESGQNEQRKFRERKSFGGLNVTSRFHGRGEYSAS